MLIRSSAIFRGMLERNIEENNSSILEIVKITMVSVKALMDYLYDKLDERDMLKYYDVLISAVNRYNITGLKEHYKDMLL